MKGNILQYLTMLGGKTPEGAALILIGLMAFGAIPVSYPLAGIIAGVVAVGKISDAVKNRPRITHEPGQNPRIKMPNQKGFIRLHAMILLLLVTATMLFLQGCLANHPLLKGNSLKAVAQVAQDYIIPADGVACKNIAVYPGYELDFSEAERTGKAEDLYHGFGGIIGGCGKYGRISCFYMDGNENGEVVCQEVEVLESESKKQPTTLNDDNDDKEDGDEDTEDDEDDDKLAFIQRE